jgi:hypothetical protein
MRASMKPRTFPAFECDHMRPKVFIAGLGDWYHVDTNGHVTSVCIAGTYEVTATYEGEHTLDRLVLDAHDG